MPVAATRKEHTTFMEYNQAANSRCIMKNESCASGKKCRSEPGPGRTQVSCKQLPKQGISQAGGAHRNMRSCRGKGIDSYGTKGIPARIR